MGIPIYSLSHPVVEEGCELFFLTYMNGREVHRHDWLWHSSSTAFRGFEDGSRPQQHTPQPKPSSDEKRAMAMGPFTTPRDNHSLQGRSRLNSSSSSEWKMAPRSIIAIVFDCLPAQLSLPLFSTTIIYIYDCRNCQQNSASGHFAYPQTLEHLQ